MACERPLGHLYRAFGWWLLPLLASALLVLAQESLTNTVAASVAISGAVLAPASVMSLINCPEMAPFHTIAAAWPLYLVLQGGLAWWTWRGTKAAPPAGSQCPKNGLE
jgi:hypothetical protein